MIRCYLKPLTDTKTDRHFEPVWCDVCFGAYHVLIGGLSLSKETQGKSFFGQLLQKASDNFAHQLKLAEHTNT